MDLVDHMQWVIDMKFLNSHRGSKAFNQRIIERKKYDLGINAFPSTKKAIRIVNSEIDRLNNDPT